MAKLLDAARRGGTASAITCCCSMMWRHGLRVSEAMRMRRDQLNLKRARVWVARLKNSLSVEHPIDGDELRAIKRYLATRTDKLPWLFVTERGTPMTRQAVNYILREAGERAGLRVHPHMLRHSCGYHLAERGHRPAHDAGLPRPSRSQAHGALHAGRGRRFEGIWKR